MKKLAFVFAALTLSLGACKKEEAKPTDTTTPAETKPAETKPAEEAAKPAEEAKPAEAAAGDSIGVPECDKFITAYRACVDKMPEAARGPAADGLKQMVDAWKQTAAAGDSAKQALATGCKQAYDNSKQAMAAACPDVKWE